MASRARDTSQPETTLYEYHQEAMEVWGRLSRLSDSEVMEKAQDAESETNAVWATSGIAGMVLAGLGMRKEDEDAEGEDVILWTKLAARPLAKVHFFYREAKKKKPEERVGYLSKFAKRVPALPEAARMYPAIRGEG